jgi:hypothetical protein
MMKRVETGASISFSVTVPPRPFWIEPVRSEALMSLGSKLAKIPDQRVLKSDVRIL